MRGYCEVAQITIKINRLLIGIGAKTACTGWLKELRLGAAK